MKVVELSQVDAGMLELVGGKGAGLAALIRAGERVPPGFCVTTEAYRSGDVPVEAVLEAYDRMGGGPVAVRSSATAEDLPDASFAGQQDTYLNIEGHDELVDAIRRCWASLHNERAIAYREAHGIAEPTMAVIVQRMVDAEVAGVLFTANPITGRRTEMVVDAAPGLGTAVVDGSVNTDHYVIDDEPPADRNAGADGRAGSEGRAGSDAKAGTDGCLTDERLVELRTVGGRVQAAFGAPQDIEWAYDRDNTLWLVQSRAITTLFPLPPERADGPRVYFEWGHMEGMLRPLTPMGLSSFRAALAGIAGTWGIALDPDEGPRTVVDIGGRLYADITGLLRDRKLRGRVPDMLKVYGPRAADAVAYVSKDPRFAARPGWRAGGSTRRAMTRSMLRLMPGLSVGILYALAKPDAARAKAMRLADDARRSVVPSGPLAGSDPGHAAARLAYARDVQTTVLGSVTGSGMAAISAGMMARQAPTGLLRGLASEAEVERAWRGLPYSVTTEMNLALWALTQDPRVTANRELLLSTPPEELANRYLQGDLPDIGLEGFLAAYGQRAAEEVDVGVPRWSEDPTPVFASIANYLLITDPAQAPDRRFAEAAREAEAAIDELVRLGLRRRPVRGRLARFFLDRGRKLAGLRELGKFIWLYPLAEMRRQLLIVGAELAERGVLERAGDIMFLTLREASEALSPERSADGSGAVSAGSAAGSVSADGSGALAGKEFRALVTERREFHEREARRPVVPGLLLSDGTDVEAIVPRPPAPAGSLLGMAAAPGVASGSARVVRDPTDARVEPGEILVAPTTDPGWTPLFMTAAGLVTETGSPMAHGPTVAREYGIPAVIAVPDATRRISTGDRITVDGSGGLVTFDATPAEPDPTAPAEPEPSAAAEPEPSAAAEPEPASG